MTSVIDSFGPCIAWAKTRGNAHVTILSTRASFTRNLSGFRFSHRLPPEELRSLRRRVLRAIKERGLLPGALCLETETLSPHEKKFLAERHHIPYALAALVRPAGAVISPDENLSVTINEEDHLRLQGLFSGFAVEEAFGSAKKLESSLGGTLPYARGGKFGCLAACPSNAGTGLRVSFLAHLPALARLGEIPATLESLSRLGVCASGISGEGTCFLGDFYQLSNAACLGLSEERLCRSMGSLVKNLCDRETAARETLFNSPHKLETEDAVFRAYGTLKHARLLSYQEFMRHLSLLRLGAAMGRGAGSDTGALDQLALLAQPAHLQRKSDGRLSPSGCGALRAEFVRRTLA